MGGAARVGHTPLPGIGVRYDLVTRERRRLSVIAHLDGSRTLNVHRKDDPDDTALCLRLNTEEAAAVVDALLPSHHSPNLLATAELGLVAERIELSPPRTGTDACWATPACARRPASPWWPYCVAPRRSRRRARTSGWPAATLSS